MALGGGNETGKTVAIGADFSGCNLVKLNAAGADLSHADFTGAALSNVNFAGANLSGADLTNANMQDVCLDGCIMYGVQCDPQALYNDVMAGKVTLNGAIGVTPNHERGTMEIESVPGREADRAAAIAEEVAGYREASYAHFKGVDGQAAAMQGVKELAMASDVGLAEAPELGPQQGQAPPMNIEALATEYAEMRTMVSEAEAAAAKEGATPDQIAGIGRDVQAAMEGVDGPEAREAGLKVAEEAGRGLA